MLSLLLDIVPNEDGNFYFDNWGEPFLYALIGFVIVFAGILLLILIVWLIGLLMRKTDNLAFLSSKRRKKENKKPVDEAVESTSVTGGQHETAEPEDGDEIPDDVRAAIIAAVVAYCVDEEKSGCEFVVRRIRRI